MKNKGFTLLELVIVLAVITILMAILIPSLTTLIENATDVKRQTELRDAYTEYLASFADEGSENYAKEPVEKENLVFKYTDGKFYNDDGSGTYVENKDYVEDEEGLLGTFNNNKIEIYSTLTE